MNGQETKAHKAILSARSSILRAMFERDPIQTRMSRIEISDIDENTVGELLRLIYTSETANYDNMNNPLGTIDIHAKLVQMADSSSESDESAARNDVLDYIISISSTLGRDASLSI